MCRNQGRGLRAGYMYRSQGRGLGNGGKLRAEMQGVQELGQEDGCVEGSGQRTGWGGGEGPHQGGQATAPGAGWDGRD